MNKLIATAFILFLVSLCTPLSVAAYSKKDNNFEFTQNRASITGMLTSYDSWQVELGYHYMFNRYIGLGGGIGTWKVYFEDGFASGKNWDIESDDNKPWNLYLRPSIILKTPAIKLGQVDLGLFAEPGIMMNVPYRKVWIRQYTNWPIYDSKSISTTKGQWCAIDARIGIYVNFGPCGFSAGYMMSNLDVYSSYRHLYYQGISFREFYPKKTFMQGAYLTASYYF